MPAALAASIILSLSSIKVRPASTASTVVPVSRMTGMVSSPITGTSNSRCSRRRATLTIAMRRPLTRVAARRSMASVPSMASTATQARSQIATLCPTSNPASALATRRPYAISAVSSFSGRRIVITPASASRGLSRVVESRR